MLPLTSCLVQQPRSGRQYQGCCNVHNVLIELHSILVKEVCQEFLQLLLGECRMCRDIDWAGTR